MSDSFGSHHHHLHHQTPMHLLGAGGQTSALGGPSAFRRPTSAKASRRKLESEDSSYDSDHENNSCSPLFGGGLLAPGSHLHVSKSHDDVSRTPSETLGQEFSEHVTLGGSSASSELDQVLSEPGYAAKVEFALRLGYTEDLLRKALVKLGPAAAENQVKEKGLTKFARE